MKLFVIYTERKNWSPDGGHNYLKWPTNRHGCVTLEGKGIYGSLLSAFVVARQILNSKTDLICIAGYVHFATVVAIICSVFMRKNFVVHADEFNNKQPQGRLHRLKWIYRELLRAFIFKYGDGILVCGRRGIETALLAGCKKEKILDFPYVIDVERIKIDAPEVIPPVCIEDIDAEQTVIFFSGRMIPRKGLPTLLKALSDIPISKKWVLWIEGDGPELSRYQSLAQEHGIQERCKFLGFCQFDVHSWLIRSSDIVVVPSLVDPWGIVVDEGIQLGKVVISSDATGAGYDRVLNGHNGFIFPAGDAVSLSTLLDALIDDVHQRAHIGEAALSGTRHVRAADNLEKLLNLIKKEMPANKFTFGISS